MIFEARPSASLNKVILMKSQELMGRRIPETLTQGDFQLGLFEREIIEFEHSGGRPTHDHRGLASSSRRNRQLYALKLSTRIQRDGRGARVVWVRY